MNKTEKFLSYMAAGLVSIVFIVLIMKHNQNSSYEEKQTKYQYQIDSLHTIANSYEDINKRLKSSLDSISAIPAKIKIKYQTQYEKIKTLPADSIISEFKRIFTDEAIN